MERKSIVGSRTGVIADLSVIKKEERKGKENKDKKEKVE